MSLLSVVQQVCSVVGVARPLGVIPGINTNRTMQEMYDLANEMAQRIAYDTRDWQVLRRLATNTGDGVTTAFNLPANYKRMLLSSNVWASTSKVQPMRFIVDPDEWIQRRAVGWADPVGEWTMMGGQMLIFPAMGSAVTATFLYLDKNAIALASPPGAFGNEFQTDADTFRLDERLLKLGMIWQWKANKGSPYAEDMGTYSDAIANAMGHDQPAPTYIGRSPISTSVRVSYPFATPSGPVMPVGP